MFLTPSVPECYCVSTVGLDEATVREYIREQEEREKEQLDLGLE